MIYLLPALTAFALTVLGCLLAIRFFPRWGLLDRPERYGLTRTPIPYPGGIVLFFVFVITASLFLEFDLKMIALILSSGLIVAVSYWDDRHPLPPWLRLMVQAVAGLILVLGGALILSITHPLGGSIALDGYRWSLNLGSWHKEILVIPALFTIVWLVVVINVINWLDGISGLPSGMSALGGTILFFLSISSLVHQPEVAKLSIIVAAMSLGFWLFDFYPPKILMGDSGAMFLGLLLGALAIFSGGKVATAFLVLGFPILDAVQVGLRRIAQGKAPWKGGEWDRERRAVHLHHRLLKSGFSPRQVLFFLYFFSAVFGIGALFLETRGKLLAILMMLGIMSVIGSVLRQKK